MTYLEPISETTYLSAQNAPQYRRIMRIFFNEYEKMHFQLYKEDVLEKIREYEEYSDYSMDKLKSDLDALVAWKNLSTLQDPKRVYTIAEYKNKQFRYTMSEYAVEIERMTVRLENLFIETGTLSTNLFVRLADSIRQAMGMEHRELQEINEWWRNLQEDFKRLNQDYQDYLREFYSDKSEKLLKSMEFIVHKDHFIAYLREFISELQKHSRNIVRLLDNNAEHIEKQLLDKVVESELAIPHALDEYSDMREGMIRQNTYGKWYSLKGWFVSHDGHQAECGQILDITNEIIRSIIQNAALIIQISNFGVSRKDDYVRYMKMFGDCADIEEAHKLSAHLFGAVNIAHFKANHDRDTDSFGSGVYEETPMEYRLKPHTRQYHEKNDREGFTDKTFEKYMQKQAYIKQLEEEKDAALRYINDDVLDISKIEGQVPAKIRDILLRWISTALLSGNHGAKTEYGREYTLIRKKGECVLDCEDGKLTMPAYILKFK